MSTSVLIGGVVVAAGACPAMVWFSRRRGRAAPCRLPHRAPEQDLPLDELRRRRTHINAAPARREANDAATGSPTGRPAA